MSIFSKTIEYINTHDKHFNIHDVNKYIYGQYPPSTNTVLQYLRGLWYCGFLENKPTFDVTYHRIKKIPSFVTTTKLNLWSNCYYGEKRTQKILTDCRLATIKGIIKNIDDII